MKKLDLIAEQKQDHLELLKDFYSSFKKEIETAYLANGGKMCPDCGSPMSDRVSKKGEKFKGCSKFPLCRKIIDI